MRGLTERERAGQSWKREQPSTSQVVTTEPRALLERELWAAGKVSITRLIVGHADWIWVSGWLGLFKGLKKMCVSGRAFCLEDGD